MENLAEKYFLELGFIQGLFLGNELYYALWYKVSLLGET